MNFALLHGGGQGSWVWDETADFLRNAGANVIALDVPGCGTKRAVETIGYSVDAVVDELNAEMRETGHSDFLFVGHSQAGTLMPAMWRKDPQLYRRLVYLSCSGPLDGQSVVDMMGEGVHGAHPDQVGWPLDPATNERLVVRRLAFCNDMDEAMAEEFMSRPQLDQWPPGVTFAAHWDYSGLEACPSDYIICDRDQILPVDWQHRFSERLKCQRILHIDAGHQAMTTQPKALAELLMAHA